MKKIVKYPLIGCASLLSIIVILALGGLVYWNHLMSAAGLKEDWNEKDGTIIENLAYGNLPDNNFDLYIPAKASKEIPQALMLFIYGGSWVGGDKGEEVFACRRYAKEGYFTATMSYTLAASNEKASIMSILDEIQACITRIKEYTDSLGYHVERMATSGISAGGHLALLYALKCYDQSPIPVVFVAERVGPFDLTKLFDVPEDKIDEIARSLKEGKPSKNKDEIDALIYMTSGQKMTKHMYTKAIIDSLLLTASPVTYVTSRSVPGVFAYGAKDEIVAPVQAHLLQETYKRLNIPHSFFLFPNSNHFLGSDPEHTDQYIAEVKNTAKNILAINMLSLISFKVSFYSKRLPSAVFLRYTAGNGSIYKRVNCNGFVEHLSRYHGFVQGKYQNIESIRRTIPSQYIACFEQGLKS